MLFDPAEIPKRDVYGAMIRVIVPRPIAWVSTLSPEGQANIAPFSFFMGITSNPPTLAFAAGNHRDGRVKDTAANAIATGEFVVNVVPDRLAPAMVQTAGDYDEGVDEFDVASLEKSPSKRIAAPRVAAAPVHIECTLHQVVPILDDDGAETSRIVIGRIQLIEADDAVLDDEGRIDPAKLDATGRMGGQGYCRTRDLFEIPRPVLR